MLRKGGTATIIGMIPEGQKIEIARLRVRSTRSAIQGSQHGL